MLTKSLPIVTFQARNGRITQGVEFNRGKCPETGRNMVTVRVDAPCKMMPTAMGLKEINYCYQDILEEYILPNKNVD